MKPLRIITAILFIFMFGRVDSASAETTIIHAGQLMSVPGQPIEGEKSIVIEDGIIAQLYNGYVRPEDLNLDGEVNVIYLGDMFVMPGLIDMHVHLSGQLGPGSRTEAFILEDSEIALRASMFARKTLEAGFTTLRDAGGNPTIMIGLKNSINKGYVIGPRLVFAGPVPITGGHGSNSGYRDDLDEFFFSKSSCDGPLDCRRAARKVIQQGADWIKVAATGGVLTDTDTGTDQQMMDDELEAIVTAANMMNRKVAAHAHGANGINAALRAGVATIEHGTFLNDESILLFQETGAYYVPTILAGQTVMEIAQNTDVFPPKIAAKALVIGPMIKEAVRRAHAAGVKIAFGTDSGVSPHGQNAREFVLMVEAGMSPEAAIIAATTNAADALGLSDEIGTIEVGKAADIIAVNGSPLLNIEQLLDVDFVMKGGAVIKE